MRPLAMLALALCVACAGPTPTSVEVGAWLPPRPTDLRVLAEEVRAHGGVVVSGQIATRAAAADVLMTVPGIPTGVLVPVERITLELTDGLGSEVGVVEMLAASAPPFVVDEAGAGSGRTLQGLEEARWDRRVGPVGEAVWFAVPTVSGLMLVWAAPVSEGVVDGDGTLTARPFAVELLRSGARMALDAGSLAPPPPASLEALASAIRAEGGVVLLASVSDVTMSASSVLPGPEPALSLAYPRGVASLVVLDDLAEDVEQDVAVEGAVGGPVLVDPMGVESDSWRVSGDPALWLRRRLPTDGLYVFFLSGSSDGAFVRWAAPADLGLVSGDGTTAGGTVSLDALRRSGS